jgi:hypothetical protein
MFWAWLCWIFGLNSIYAALLPVVLQVVLPLDAPKVLMLELAEEVAANVLVHHVPGIQAVSCSCCNTTSSSKKIMLSCFLRADSGGTS